MAVRRFREFIQLESSGGIILFVAALLAIFATNSPVAATYHQFFETKISIHFGTYGLSKPLLLWIDDGLMAIFFLLVGLEIKRELFEGELHGKEKAFLPGVAAIGGMLVPALCFIALNHNDPSALKGWAIPTATDIAFSLGILSLLGKRVPLSLKVFLTALAIFDDIGAIVIIAVFYTEYIALSLLLAGSFFVGVLSLLNRLKITRYAPYCLVGLCLWLCVLKSGVHATLAGILIALAIPLKNEKNPRVSPARQLESALHPWVAFGVLPIFAFANAGVSFSQFHWHDLLHAIPAGTALGLFLGKQIGIWGATMLTVTLTRSKLPEGMTPTSLYGISALAGVGFTMSLFINELAFGLSPGHYNDLARLGIILGSALSGIVGYAVLSLAHSKKR